MIEQYHLEDVRNAYLQGNAALNADSNDAEHEALWGLMEEVYVLLIAAGLDVPEVGAVIDATR